MDMLTANGRLANDAVWVAGGNKWRFGLNMKTISSLAVVTALAALGLGSPRAQAADEEGLAVAIVYDTSGSMQEQVRDRDGKSAPKYVIANRALIAIAKQIQTFATNSASGARRRIDAGLYVF